MSDATITASDRGAKGDTRELAKTLFQHYAGFYGCGAGTTWYGNARVLGWRCDSSDEPAGYFQEPWEGPIEPEPYAPGAAVACVWRGFRLTADARVSISHGGTGVMVASSTEDDPCWSLVAIRQNGVVIASDLDVDPNVGLHGFAYGAQIEIADVLASVGDLFEVTWEHGGNWSDYAYYAQNPADRNAETHFRISGETLPGKPFLRASVNTTSPL